MVRVKIKWNTIGSQETKSRELDLTDSGLLTIQRASGSEQSSLVCSLIGMSVEAVSHIELEFSNQMDYD